MNTHLHYMYRDGDNYKQGEDVVFAGEITVAEKELIIKSRDEDEYFIPSQVGLEDLQSRMINFPDDSDHVWHELEDDDINLTSDVPTEVMDIHEFAKRFEGVQWDIAKAMEDNGISV